MEGQKYI